MRPTCAAALVSVSLATPNVCSAQQPNCTAAHRCDTVFYLTSQAQTHPEILAVTTSSVFYAGDSRFQGPSAMRWFVGLDRATANAVSMLTSFDCNSGPTHAVFVNSVFYWSSSVGLCSARAGGTVSSRIVVRPISGFAVTTSNIYFSNSIDVERVPLTGGTGSVIDAMRDVKFFTTTPHFVVWSTTSGTIHYCMITGSPVGALATNLGIASAIAADDTNVYLATTTAILRITMTNGATTVLVSHAADNLALDGSDLYWSRTNAGEIGKVAIAGGAPTIVSSSAGAPGSLLVDGTSVFYTELHTATIRVITPK